VIIIIPDFYFFFRPKVVISLLKSQRTKVMVDINYLREISDGDQEFMLDLINTYLQQFPSFCRNMREFANSARYAELEKEAHTAKSSGLALNLTELSLLLTEMQGVARKEATPEICSDVLDKIEAVFEQTAEALVMLIEQG
jgi:HPt (histidine-containing phosphotransfer) domain-containing protein